jgi:hypothetical protein
LLAPGAPPGNHGRSDKLEGLMFERGRRAPRRAFLRVGDDDATVRAKSTARLRQMIYRVLCDGRDPLSGRTRFSGAWCAGLGGFEGLRMPAVCERWRFYFTEHGWRHVGLGVVRQARAEDRVVKIIRRRNPPRSQVVYADAYQLAVLPCAKSMRRRPAKPHASSTFRKS